MLRSLSGIQVRMQWSRMVLLSLQWLYNCDASSHFCQHPFKSSRLVAGTSLVRLPHAQMVSPGCAPSHYLRLLTTWRAFTLAAAGVLQQLSHHTTMLSIVMPLNDCGTCLGCGHASLSELYKQSNPNEGISRAQGKPGMLQERY